MRRGVLLSTFSVIAACSCGGATVSSQRQGGDGGADSAHRADAAQGADVGRPPADAAAPDAPTAEDSGPPSLTRACYGVKGLTGQAVLDALQPVYSATFDPKKPASPTALTIRTHYAGGKVTCHPACYAKACGGLGYPAWIVLDVQVEFVTADGLFNETFVAPMGLHPGAGATNLEWSGYVPAAEIKGTYMAPYTGDPNDVVSFNGLSGATTTSGEVEEDAVAGSATKVAVVGYWK